MNEEFFNKVRRHLVDLGVVDQLTYFDNLENFIKWKGKEDSSRYSGKGMVGN